MVPLASAAEAVSFNARSIWKSTERALGVCWGGGGSKGIKRKNYLVEKQQRNLSYQWGYS